MRHEGIPSFPITKRRSTLYIRYSIWITALTVIILIVFLGLTVYYVREKAIVELFSEQQATIAAQMASRVEESIAKCEKGMLMLSRLMVSPDATWTERQENIDALYEELRDVVMSIVEVDPGDNIINGYPENTFAGLRGKKFNDQAVLHAMKKLNQRYTGEISGISDTGATKSIGIGLPVLKPDGGYNGAIIALLQPKLVLGRTIPLDRTYMNDFWLVDESGSVVFHSNKDFAVADLNKLNREGENSFRMFSYRSDHYEEIMITQKGVQKKCIIAYAPIRIGISQWWVVLVTPYDKILVPIRSASFNIILGAFGLIAVVIITTVSIARSDVKRLRLKEELKLLREREEWQGKLLREKMTVDGIIEGSPVPTFVIDTSHKIILWNRACTDLTGYSSREMIGTGDYYKPFYEEKRPFLADFIVDRNTDSFDQYYGDSKVVRSESIEGAYEAVKHFKNLRGKDRHLHFLAAPIFDEKGEIIAAIETFLDVTKEVDLTRDLKEYAETLQNELEENIRLRKEVEDLLNYLRSIIDSLPDKIYELNREGIINYVSRHLEEGLKTDDSDPQGKHFTEYVAPEHRDYVMAKWENAKKGIFEPYELEVTNRRGKRHLLLTPGPVKGTDRFVLVERDVTELKELESKYYESQKLAAIGQLSAGIAHEVRNPLSSIKMSLQILEKRIQPEGNDLKRFKIAQREVEHLEKLVSDVLIYAKPLVPQMEPSDMRSVIEGALAMVEKGIDEKSIEVVREFPENLGMVSVDPSMIRQALINLFQNATDAMEEKGRLRIALKEDTEHLILEVADNGCGIDEEDRPHLFNPFFTRKSYGTGLGLTQVQKLIVQHGGEIEVRSKKGEGTCFIITLPRDAK
jgi:PAS domain S-box-containing protein